MKYVIIAILFLVCSVCHGAKYKRTPPKEPLIIEHEWWFDDAELKEIMINELKRKGVVLPKGKISIWHTTCGGNPALGMCGLDVVIEEQTTIVEDQ